MTYKITTFVMQEEVAKIIDELPWGKRSDFINKCIIDASPNLDGSLHRKRVRGAEEPDSTTTDSNQSENSSQPSKPSTAHKTPSSEPAATAKPPATSSEHGTLTKSIKSLL